VRQQVTGARRGMLVALVQTRGTRGGKCILQPASLPLGRVSTTPQAHLLGSKRIKGPILVMQARESDGRKGMGRGNRDAGGRREDGDGQTFDIKV
jgi:hypothetical protein